MYNDVIKGILMNYSSNELFQLFVHSYIKQDTLRQLTSFNALLPLSLYLSDCCNGLIHAVNTVVTTKEKYVTEELFVWQSIPDEKNATDRLRVFLKNDVNLNWVDCARFEKINDNSLIISYRANYALIKLNATKTKAALIIYGKVKFEFTLKEFKKKNEESEAYIVVYVPRSTVEEIESKFLVVYTQNRVPSFVCSLILSVTPASDDFRILSQDKTFLNTLDKTKTQFINKCSVITKM